MSPNDYSGWKSVITPPPPADYSNQAMSGGWFSELRTRQFFFIFATTTLRQRNISFSDMKKYEKCEGLGVYINGAATTNIVIMQ